MRWTILSDFDNTISLSDVTDTLLETYALPEWREIEIQWQQGLIGSRICMQQQIELLRATRDELDATIDAIEIDPHFVEFAQLCKAYKLPLTIVSDGLDYVIKRTLAKHGLQRLSVVAAHLKQVNPDRWRLTSPYAENDCGSVAVTCKCREAVRQKSINDAARILYIGDGRSDYCVSTKRADLILAKASLLTHCQENNLPHLSFANFADVTYTLRHILAEQNFTPSFLMEKIYA